MPIYLIVTQKYRRNGQIASNLEIQSFHQNQGLKYLILWCLDKFEMNLTHNIPFCVYNS